MTREYYIRDEQPGSPFLRRLLIALLILALAGGTSIGLFISLSDRQARQVLLDYRQALQENR